MLLVILVVLAFVLVIGGAFAWITSGNRNHQAETRLRTEQLAAELAQRTAELEGARAAYAAQNQRETTLREQIARLENGNETSTLRLQQTLEALDHSRAANDQLRDQSTALQTQLAELRANLDSERANSQEKLAILTAARQELSNQFEALANKILEEKSKRFTEQNQANIGNLITPLKEKFGEFQLKVESLQKDGIAGRSELKAQIDSLRSLNERLSQDASNLVSALKGSSKTQGGWGELVLETLLESSGLRKGHEYRVQTNFLKDDGRRAQPDLILNLPGNKHLVIDSKVSLSDYDDYCSTEDETARQASLNRHVASMRTHIKDLSLRNYQTLHGLNSIDFVVMFVPIEPAFMLALAQEGKLWQEAWDKSILLVSRTTLLFVLRTVAHLWRQEQQAKNVQEIVRRGSELYDKLAAFAKDLTDVGKSLDAARNTYDEAYKKLAQGKGNVIRQAEMLKTLGIKPTKNMPLGLVEHATEDRNEADEPLELAASADLALGDTISEAEAK
jgi:DNA recombination protein RmuC